MKRNNLFGLLMSVILMIALIAGNAFALENLKIKTNAHCGMCKGNIEKSLKKVEGVSEATLSLDDKIASVSYNAEKTSPEKLVQAVSDAGYKAELVSNDKTSTSVESADKKGCDPAKCKMECKKAGKAMDNEKCCKGKDMDKCCKSKGNMDKMKAPDKKIEQK